MSKFILLDRDGTIIVEKNYLSDVNQIEYIPGVENALFDLAKAGWRFLVISNQSGIGRGYFGAHQVQAINNRISDHFNEWGIRLEKFYYCPHIPEQFCNCRKPNTGLFDCAKLEFPLDLKSLIVIGDKKCDIQLGYNIGAKTILVLTGHGRDNIDGTEARADFIAKDIKEASDAILSNRLGCFAS